MGSILGSVLRGFPRSSVHGLAECGEPGGDYRGGVESRLKGQSPRLEVLKFKVKKFKVKKFKVKKLKV